jgi:hypothetical protein
MGAELPNLGQNKAMFVPDRLSKNAYRLLGLSASATLSEIHRAGAAMRRAASLGLAETTEADIPMLGEISRTEAEIRAAIGRLENPIQRLSDGLFWFHLPPESRSAKAPALPDEPDGAAWDHDEALTGVLAAFHAGFDGVGVPVWVRALRAWHQLIADDDYWAHVAELEQRGAFEPAAFPSEIDALRDEAVGLAAEPLVVAGRDALARDDTSTVRRILDALGELADTGPWVATAQHDIVSPAVERFRALCRAVHDEFGSQIVREQDAGERNKRVCDAELKRFRADIEPGLHRVIQLLPTNHQTAQESSEEAALCLSTIATDYTWADDFITSEKLREEALSLARDTLGAIRIEDGLAQIREAARRQRVYGTPISSAPSLSTFNGFGFALLGRSDYDAETRSYSTTHYFVALFILPIFPIGRYRVIDAGGNRYSFLGKLPLRKADRWHLGIVLTAIAAMILIGALSSANSNVSSTTSTSSYPTSSQTSQASTAESAELTGAYSGVVQNLTAGVSADFQILVTETNGAINGCMEVKPPLVGSGSLRGTANGANFSFVVASDAMQLAFDGQRIGTHLSGTYLVSNRDGGAKQNGTFVLNRISSQGLSGGFTISNCRGDAPLVSTPAEPSALKARIEAGRSQMAVLKSQLQPVIDEITTLNAQMETLKAELKSLDQQQKSGLQIDIDDYNAKVKTHNALLAKQRALITANRTDLKTYDDLVDQDSVLVKQYNALLKSQ